MPGSNYKSRPKTSNFNSTVMVRLLDTQKKRLEKYSVKYKMTESEIVREALTMWLNSQGEV